MGCKDMIYFDNCSTSFPKAPGVSDRVKEIIDEGCFNINRGSYAGAWTMAEIVFDTRERLADLFGFKKSRNVIFTGGVTQSLNMVIKGCLKPGDHVITTQMEHNAVLRPLFQLKKKGVEVDFVSCNRNGELSVVDFIQKMKPNTKMVVMTHASNVCGTVMPIKEAGAICREKGIVFVVDAAQTAGVLPILMDDWGIDVLAFAGHKGLLAPQGIGGFLIQDHVAERMEALLSGGTGSFSDSLEIPAVLPDKFEAGTLNLPGIAALNTSLSYLKGIGIEHIYETESKLLRYFTSEVKRIPGVRLVGDNGTEKCAVAALDFLNMDNGEAAGRLDEEYQIMTRSGLHCAPMAHHALGTFPKGVVRCSFGYANTVQEVDFFLEAVEEICTW